jgi:hypothetical protein
MTSSFIDLKFTTIPTYAKRGNTPNTVFPLHFSMEPKVAEPHL